MVCGLSHTHYNASCHYNPSFANVIERGCRLPVVGRRMHPGYYKCTRGFMRDEVEAGLFII
jgi:hypothetical protein